MTTLKTTTLICVILFLSGYAKGQNSFGNSGDHPPATIILFRTFSLFSATFSYKLFVNDSLLGRMNTHDVIILETDDNQISFHATTRAPSLNADKRTNYQKRKTIKYPFSLQPGQVYFVKCGFLNQRLFDYPRQATIRLIKNEEMKKYLRKRFIRKKIKTYLYTEWQAEKNLFSP